jgi:hypothetical protein
MAPSDCALLAEIGARAANEIVNPQYSADQLT